MIIDELSYTHQFVDRIVDYIAAAPHSLPDAVSFLGDLRRFAHEGIASALQQPETAASLAPEEERMLQLIHGAHLDLLAAADRALEQLAAGRGATPSLVWTKFSKVYAATAVRARGEIAEHLRLLESETIGFADFPRSVREQLFLFIGGFNIVGIALSKDQGFRTRVARLFDDPRVIDACQTRGPLAGADQFLALYLDVSPTTIHSRLKECEQRSK